MTSFILPYVIIGLFVAIIFATFISKIGEKRKIGASSAFAVSVLLGPLLGLIIVLASDELEKETPETAGPPHENQKKEEIKIVTQEEFDRIKALEELDKIRKEEERIKEEEERKRRERELEEERIKQEEERKRREIQRDEEGAENLRFGVLKVILFVFAVLIIIFLRDNFNNESIERMGNGSVEQVDTTESPSVPYVGEGRSGDKIAETIKTFPAFREYSESGKNTDSNTYYDYDEKEWAN